MKILVIGSTGLIGSAVIKELSARHEMIAVGHSQGELTVDIRDSNAITNMYEKVGKVDAIIATTGKVVFAALQDLHDQQFRVGINDKLMGQINLVQIGLSYINDNGSFTLTSGILNVDPIRTGTAAAMVNGALEGYVRSAAIEMPRGIRINVVSPTVISEAMPGYGPYFRGFKSVAVDEVALAYSKSVEGLQTGQIYRVGY